MSVDAGLDVAEVSLPIDGALYSAPIGTALPTNATDPLDAAFVGHGYWTSDGLTETSATTTSEQRAFQGNVLVANPVTGGTASIQVSLLQKSAENKGLYYGDVVDSATGGVRWRPGVAKGRRVFVVDKIYGDGSTERIVVEVGEVTATGDRVTVQGTVPAYPITISVYGDSAVIYDTALVA